MLVPSYLKRPKYGWIWNAEIAQAKQCNTSTWLIRYTPITKFCKVVDVHVGHVRRDHGFLNTLIRLESCHWLVPQPHRSIQIVIHMCIFIPHDLRPNNRGGRIGRRIQDSPWNMSQIRAVCFDCVIPMMIGRYMLYFLLSWVAMPAMWMCTRTIGRWHWMLWIKSTSISDKFVITTLAVQLW